MSVTGLITGLVICVREKLIRVLKPSMPGCSLEEVVFGDKKGG